MTLRRLADRQESAVFPPSRAAKNSQFCSSQYLPEDMIGYENGADHPSLCGCCMQAARKRGKGLLQGSGGLRIYMGRCAQGNPWKLAKEFTASGNGMLVKRKMCRFKTTCH